jgi:hypothetical protein
MGQKRYAELSLQRIVPLASVVLASVVLVFVVLASVVLVFVVLVFVVSSCLCALLVHLCVKESGALVSFTHFFYFFLLLLSSLHLTSLHFTPQHTQSNS